MLLTGPQAMIALANNTKIQFFDADKWQDAISCTAAQFLTEAFKFRVEPMLVSIGSIEIEAPERGPLNAGVTYYTPSITEIDFFLPVTWSDYQRDQNNLMRGIVHLTPENAIAHAKALITISGGSFNVPDPKPVAELPVPELEEPAPVLDHEDPPASEKKRRNRKPSLVSPVEPAPTANDEEPMTFITPPAVQFDEPQPEDIKPDDATPGLSDRMKYLLADIAKATTAGQVMSIKMRYTSGLSAEDMAIIESEMGKRNRELMKLSIPESLPTPVERPSLAVRINTCRDLKELASLVDEINFIDPAIQPRMIDVYNQRRKVLLNAKDEQP